MRGAPKKKPAKVRNKKVRAKKLEPLKVRETAGEKIKRARRMSNKLRKLYGRRGTALHHDNPFQLLAATILSAQCTDAMVNSVTPRLFAEYPDAASLARAEPRIVEELIHSTGFFRQKTRSLLSMSKSLTEQFGGRVPESIEELTTLGGVGRKTAHVVRGMCFGKPAIIVDTHFKRLAGRMGLTDQTDPTKIEFEIAELLPRSHWTEFSNALIWHGRAVCPARKPDCARCTVLRDCPTGQAEIGKS